MIDEAALTRMLRSQLAGAGLDVFEHEPAINPKLRELDNVVLLPHMGSATIEGRIDMGEKVVINIKTFVDGHRHPDRVLPRQLGGGLLRAVRVRADHFRDRGEARSRAAFELAEFAGERVTFRGRDSSAARMRRRSGGLAYRATVS